jgi:hypothetical protein
MTVKHKKKGNSKNNLKTDGVDSLIAAKLN